MPLGVPGAEDCSRLRTPVERRQLRCVPGCAGSGSGLIAYGVARARAGADRRFGAGVGRWAVGGIADRTRSRSSRSSRRSMRRPSCSRAWGRRRRRSRARSNGRRRRCGRPPRPSRTCAANLAQVEGQLARSTSLAPAAGERGEPVRPDGGGPEGLDTRLETIAADLDTNRTALVDNSRELRRSGTELDRALPTASVAASSRTASRMCNSSWRCCRCWSSPGRRFPRPGAGARLVDPPDDARSGADALVAP
jgi:hypothetical protein